MQILNIYAWFFNFHDLIKKSKTSIIDPDLKKREYIFILQGCK